MATDQEIRDAGFKYVPQQQYLLNPFELPEDQEPVTNSGIVATNAFTNSGGGGGGVFNPDPNSIVNRDYQPNYEYRRFSEPDQSMIEMGRNQDYFYKPPPSKMEGLISMLPYVSSLTKGANFLKNQISPYFPVSRRSILENELGGQGIMVDNIGRIVQGQGDYNTAENIMAGYNANNLTQESVNKRKATINESLGKFDKYNKNSPKFDQDKYNQMQDKLAALNEFGNTLDSTNTLTDKIYDFEKEEKEKKKKNTLINKIFTKRKEVKAAKDAKDSSGNNTYITKTSNNKTGGGGGGHVRTKGTYDTNTSTGGSKDHRTASNRQRQREQAGPGYSDVSESGSFARGGRAGYFYGGRVNFKNGGLASIL